MYVSEMIDRMDGRLEDATRKLYPELIRINALEDAQIEIMNRVHPDELTNLQKKETGIAVTSGVVSLNALAARVVRGSAGVVKVRVAGGGRWISLIDPTKIEILEDSIYRATVFNPKGYVWENSLIIAPATITSIDIWYLAMPSPLIASLEYGADPALGNDEISFVGNSDQDLSTENDAYNGAVIYCDATKAYHVVTDYVGSTRKFTVTPSNPNGDFSTGIFRFATDPFHLTNFDSIESEIDKSLHPLMIDMAVAKCFESSNDIERRAAAKAEAEAGIAAINARYAPAEGVGTRKGR